MDKRHFNGTRHAADLTGADETVGTHMSTAGPEISREILTLEVGCETRAPAIVRAALSDLGELGPARDDVILIASELVTNAVVHSGGSPEDSIYVRAAICRDRLSLSVQDPGLSGDTPQAGRSHGWQSGGQGLRIVTKLAHGWGFERTCGCRVWAELRLPAETCIHASRTAPSAASGLTITQSAD